MDTGTHLVIGLGLAGLATVDPVVTTSSGVFAAVLLGTVLGSQAPDFDGLTRFGGNATYIRNHRGMSHSLPAIAIWTAAITLLLELIFQGLPILHVAMWVFIAVAFHVFTDLFNTYGTQAFRPFTEKNGFPGTLCISSICSFSRRMWPLWRSGCSSLPGPRSFFPALYVIIGFYYIWRSLIHYRLEKRLEGAGPGLCGRRRLLPAADIRCPNLECGEKKAARGIPAGRAERHPAQVGGQHPLL